MYLKSFFFYLTTQQLASSFQFAAACHAKFSPELLQPNLSLKTNVGIIRRGKTDQ